MPHLDIITLGGVRASLESNKLADFRTHKVRALLIFLAVEALNAHRRETLASMFWPDRPEAQARKNLRQSLYCLRNTIEDQSQSSIHLLSNHNEIQFDPDSDYNLDVKRFSAHIAAYQEHHPGMRSLCFRCLEKLKAAVALYGGDFLAGFTLPGCRQFEWWLLTKQEQYHHQALDALSRLGSYYESIGDHYLVSYYALKEIELEPWRETAHRRRMRALNLSGERVEALRQYESCRAILWHEMQIEPSRQTKDLFEMIRSGSTPFVEIARLGKFQEHFEREFKMALL